MSENNKVKLSTLPGGSKFIYGGEEYLKLAFPARNEEGSDRQAVRIEDGVLVFPMCDDPLVVLVPKD